MDGVLTTAAGQTFVTTDAAGRTAADDHGLYHRDTRYLDRHELAVGGRRLTIDGVLRPQPGEAVVAATAPADDGPDADVRRARFVVADGADGPRPGWYERIAVRNRGDGRLSLPLRVAVGTRFDDVFEVCRDVEGRTRSVGVVPGEGVAFSHDAEDTSVGARAGAAMDADAQVAVHGGLARADAVLETDLQVPRAGRPGSTSRPRSATRRRPPPTRSQRPARTSDGAPGGGGRPSPCPRWATDGRRWCGARSRTCRR